MSTDFALLQQLWKNIFQDDKMVINAAAKAQKTTAEELKKNREIFMPVNSPSLGQTQLRVWSATALGDNFMSDAFFASATLKNGSEYQAFVKVLPHNQMMFLSAQAMRLHTREIAVYQYFHPKLRELRKKAGFKEDEVPLNVPEIYFTKLDEEGTSGENTTVLVMQELKSLGFTMRNKEEGCSFNEAQQVLGSLANYHALTMALIAEYRSAEDEKKLTTLPEQLQVVTAVPVIHQNYDKMVAASLPTFVAMMKALKHEETAIWLEEHFKKNGAMALRNQTIEDDCGPLTCIVHGDSWNNNMMYRYDSDGNPIEVKVVDWQLTRLGHPATDILLFLITSTSPEVRKERRALLNHYYDVLSSAREKLGLKTCSRHEFIEDIRSRLLSGIFYALPLLPTFYDLNMVVDMEEKNTQVIMEEKRAESFDMETFVSGMRETFYNLNQLMANRALCNRIIALVEEARASFDRYTGN